MRASMPCTAISSGCGDAILCWRAQRPRGVDGAVLGPEAFVLRFFGEQSTEGDGGADRLLLVNLGVDLDLDPAPEPLLAPPAGALWRVALVERGHALRRRGHAPARDARQLAHSRPRGRRPRARCPRPGRTIPARGAGEETEEAESRREALRRSWRSPDVPVLRRSLTSAGASVPEAARRPRVAGDERPRRLRRGHGRGRADATLSRPARRRAADAARAHASC